MTDEQKRLSEEAKRRAEEGKPLPSIPPSTDWRTKNEIVAGYNQGKYGTPEDKGSNK